MTASRRASCFAASLWLAGLAGGCNSTPSTSTSSAALSASAPPPIARASASTGDHAADELRPVYPVDAGPPDPIAQRFCEAIHNLPGARHAECCGPGGGAADTVTGECVRTLSFALSQHAITLAADDVDRCAEAMKKATAGCDWVVPLGSVALPPACDGIVKGTLAAKAQCRSSLECQAGLRCQGLSTIDLGTCAAPKEMRSACNLAIDVLASFTRQDHVDRDHPECEGYCARSRCDHTVAEGGACASDIACGKGRCVSGKCTSAPPPVLGEACTSECAYGARCVKGKCSAPKAEADACEVDQECRGACDRGHCQKSCPVVRLPVLKNMPPPSATTKRR